MKKEVEIKIKVDNFEAIVKKLENLGCVFSDCVMQDDTIFINYDRPFIEFTPNDIFLRIRKTGRKSIFTLKKGEEMNSVEKEFEVSDPTQLEETLVLLGYRPKVHVRKTRRKTKYNDYEICLDEVDGLGSFIEVEEITDKDSAEVQKEMITFLKNLGANEDDRVMNGYDTLTWLKDNQSYKK